MVAKFNESRLNRVKAGTTASEKTSLGSRDVARIKAYKFGTIYLGHGEEVRCIVEDFSASGMKLTLDYSVTLPGEMQVTVLAACIQRRRARKIWQSGQDAGIEFL